jgi:predicted O-linked N-acetylglucosamine transferase (SPINDLY family)
MQLFSEVDIVLDTHPFGGGTTTCHALWMGVPVISRVGDRHASRMGLSIATAVNLPHWAVDSDEQYIDRAIEQSRDVNALRELRRTMRDRSRSSPLMDARRFTAHLDQAYRRCWIEWCGSCRA